MNTRTAQQLLDEIGKPEVNAERLQVEFMKYGRNFELELRRLKREAMKSGTYPDPLTRLVRLFVKPVRSALIRLGYRLNKFLNA
ncbi:MAG: hypothetical protein OJI67_07825 [Prosthecobacter sp.]|nr:hypothetical protein [Prosthecobacter sp.]